MLLLFHALSLGAVLELSRTDGATSRIEFGAVPGGADATLSGDASSINASVPIYAPNLAEMSARIAALESLLSHFTSTLNTENIPVITIDTPVVMTRGLELSGGFTNGESSRRLQESGAAARPLDVLRVISPDTNAANPASPSNSA